MIDRDDRDPLGLSAFIEQHAWELVSAAALLGAWLGFERVRPAREGASRRQRFGAMVLSGIGAIALRVARDAAFRQLGVVAKQWWDARAEQSPAEQEQAP